MARAAQCTQVVSKLRSLFPTSLLEETARESGWLQRQRKVKPKEMFWTLVLGFGCGAQRTLAALRRAYEIETGETLVPSSFYDRFTPGLVRFLQAAVSHGLEALARSAARHAARTQALFDDVVGIDSTVLRLHALLARRYRGTRTNHSPAAAKLHLVTSVIGRGPRSIKITEGRVHDGRVRYLGAWVRGNLLLFDLGYYCFRAFSSIERNGGFFVTRLKEGANPQILEVHGDAPTSLVRPGASLQTVLMHTTRDVLDLSVSLKFRRRIYRATTRGTEQRFRIVAIRHPETRRFHVYVTNVPVEQLSPQDIAATYSGRWAIELIFKELKSSYRIHQLDTTKQHVVEALILAAVLTLIVSRVLYQALASRMPPGHARRLRPLRWATVFATHAATLLALLLDPRSLSQRARARWLAQLAHHALDPNVARRGLTDTLLAVQIPR